MMPEDYKNGFDFIEQTDKARLDFNQKYFNDCIFDLQIFNIASQLMIDYTGGYWDYLVWDKTVAFYKLSGIERCTLRNPHSGQQYEMDATLGGMVITLYALIMRIERSHSEKLIDHWHYLKNLGYEYASEIGEFDNFHGMID